MSDDSISTARGTETTGTKERGTNDPRVSDPALSDPALSAGHSAKPTFGNLPRDEPDVMTKRRSQLVEENGKWYTLESNGQRYTARGTYAFVVQGGKIWVVKPTGNVGGPNPGHTEAARGGRVEYAGMVTFGSGRTTRGNLQTWSNASGHYLPAASFSKAAIAAGLPKDKFSAFGGSRPPQGEPQLQLPVFQPLSPSGNAPSRGIGGGDDAVSRPGAKKSPTPGVAPRTPAGSPAPAGSGDGGARGTAVQVLFMAVGQILTAIGDEIQRRAAETAFNEYAPSISAFLHSHPELGALIVFRFTQQVSNPTGESSFIQPGAQFRSVDAYYGRTQIEAQLRWREAGELDVYRTRHVISRYSKQWIPPVREASQIRAKRSESHPPTTAALIREIMIDLKPPPNFTRVFHHLNGSSMRQMLQALKVVKQSGQLDLLTNNVAKAEGVNRGRIWIAIKATYLRGTYDAFKLFMADDWSRIELSGIEAEGRKAIEHILLTNKDS